LKRQFIEKFIITAPSQKAKKQKEKIPPLAPTKISSTERSLFLVPGPAFTVFF
jgi:hypothetical protein